jgi:hypothetical protein
VLRACVAAVKEIPYQRLSIPGNLRMHLASLVMVLALMLVASPAAAQLAPSRSGSSTTSYMSGEEAFNEMVSFGRCYATQSTNNALRLIATEPETREEIAVYKDLFKGDDQTCLTFASELSAPYQLIRGSIAEGLYRGRVPLPAGMILTAPEAAQVRNLAGAARCYVKGNEVDARALAETKPGSRQEQAAIQAALPAFAKCLPPGVSLNFSATLIRFRIVEGLFRTGVVRSVSVEKK